MPRKTAETYPTFSRNDFLSGMDNRRIMLVRAQSWLRWQGETCHYFSQSRTIRGEQLDGIPESRSRLITSDSWIQCCRGAAVLLFGQLFSVLRRLSSAQAPRSLGAVLEGSGHLYGRLPQ